MALTVALPLAVAVACALLLVGAPVPAHAYGGYTGPKCIPFPVLCADGRPPFSSTNAKVKGSGCKAVPDIPLSPLTMLSLAPCCDKHQTCYGTAMAKAGAGTGSGHKDECDFAFGDCAEDVCRQLDNPAGLRGLAGYGWFQGRRGNVNSPSNFFAKRDCRKWVKYVYEWTQDEAGCQAFTDAKKKYGCAEGGAAAEAGDGGDAAASGGDSA